MIPESPLTRTEHGLIPQEDGWFVLNARDSTWLHGPGRSAICDFEGNVIDFHQVGINITVLDPGVQMAMYHWEADQEDFLVVSGEAVLVVEGEERRLRAWDFVHCPAGTKHVLVGAGDAPCVVIAVGAREHSTGAHWGAYTVDEAALRHGASVEEETSDANEAYARFKRRERVAYREGWLPG
jgi:uncharacterized cupin superfamily protein